MSFDNFDLESRSGIAGTSQRKDSPTNIRRELPPPQSTYSPADESHRYLGHDDFEEFKNSISLQIFKVNSNVQGINRLVDKLGTIHDGAGLRKSL